MSRREVRIDRDRAGLASGRNGYEEVMTDHEHVENTVPEAGGDGESFDVFLPVSPAMDREGPAHVESIDALDG